ncbi:hypothetical protein HK105_207706 [Polyrhizophydium stewartii]|uniref:CENP-V/GFA domain-containing protein n=1 Tax=Polyrhizophydium stewartii TaxID=2732419 RepID=A0ABR4MZY3_9FUNG|nr:hypothetical protein HK105_002581 [Polyrhizophydium stewartii]
MATPTPVTLHGSCHCGRVVFTVDTFTPYPYMVCHCNTDTKTAGLGTANIMGEAKTLAVGGRDPSALKVYRASKASRDRAPPATLPLHPSADAVAGLAAEESPEHLSTHQRHFCGHCGTALWAFDERWPDWVYPFAIAIDAPLLPAVPPADQVHICLDFRRAYGPHIPDGVPESQRFAHYPVESIEGWHKKRGLYGTWKPEAQ